MHYDVCIIGGGPSGLWMLSQCGILGLKAVLIDGLDHPGGQCYHLYPEKNIYDIPGYPAITGQDLTLQLIKQSQQFNQKIITNTEPIQILTGNNYEINMSNYDINDTHNHITHHENHKFCIKTSNNKDIFCKNMTIATGCGKFQHRKIPLESCTQAENNFLFYKVNNKNKFANKKVIILGGGNSALDWAKELSHVASEIILIHRRDKFRGDDSTINYISQCSNIKIVYPYNIHDIDISTKTAYFKHISNNKIIKIQTDYILAFFGLEPNKSYINTLPFKYNNKSQIYVNRYCETNISDIFAIGDVAYYDTPNNHNFAKLILSGFDDATQAAHMIYKQIYPNKKISYSTSINLK